MSSVCMAGSGVPYHCTRGLPIGGKRELQYWELKRQGFGVFQEDGANGTCMCGSETGGNGEHFFTLTSQYDGRRFCLSCVRLVCFLLKSTDFHDMRTECQIILIHFFLLIFLTNRYRFLDKGCPLPYLLPNHSPIAPRRNHASVYLMLQFNIYFSLPSNF